MTKKTQPVFLASDKNAQERKTHIFVSVSLIKTYQCLQTVADTDGWFLIKAEYHHEPDDPIQLIKLQPLLRNSEDVH